MRATKARCPWVDPAAPLPKWLCRTDEELAAMTRNNRRGVLYYRKLHQSTPLWETKARLQSVYDRAHDLRSRGFDVEVDHIVPLNHPDVCGLHTLDNLQVISRTKNAKKSNRQFPGMRHAQLELFPVEDQLEFAL
jgi:5-methylcytosine-specific restriction endonuclease McrA